MEARTLLDRFGSPHDLEQVFEEAMNRATEAIRNEASEILSRHGSSATVDWLVEKQDRFPTGSSARKAIEDLVAALRAPPADETSNGEHKASRAEAPSAPEPGPGAANVSMPAPGTVASTDSRPATDQLLARSIEAAEFSLQDRDFDGAEALFKEVISGSGGKSTRGRRAEYLRRAERGLRAVAHFRGFIAALAATLGRDPGAFGFVPYGGGKSGAVLAIDGEGLTVDGAGQPLRLKWKVVPTSTLKALSRKVSLEPAQLVHVAAVLRASGAAEDALSTLIRAFKKSPEVKPAIDIELADARSMPEVPESGFTLLDNEWLSPRELKRRELNWTIETQCQALFSEKSEERERAFATLMELGDPARSQLHRSLLQVRRAVEEKVAKLKGYAALQETAALREELDRRRAHALELIFDEKKYPYPYRPPQASPEAFAQYRQNQPEVDSRVAAVREIWKDTRSIPIPTAVRDGVTRIQEVDAWIRKASFGEVPPEIPWLMNLPKGEHLTIRTVATSALDRERIDASEKVMEVNESSPGVATRGEQAQCRITNQYRLLMGRWALRLYDRLLLAARGHCEDMEKLGFFSHTSKVPGKESPIDRVRREGMDPAGLSENIAIAGGPEGAHNGWCHSPGHHRNILGAGWRLLGPGNAGAKWCQNFSVSDQNEVPAGR
jgi:uncharacterized protein YkwD